MQGCGSSKPVSALILTNTLSRVSKASHSKEPLGNQNQASTSKLAAGSLQTVTGIDKHNTAQMLLPAISKL
jgi:hypothetical protein